MIWVEMGPIWVVSNIQRLFKMYYFCILTEIYVSKDERKHRGA